MMIFREFRRRRLEKEAARRKKFLQDNVEIMPASYKKFIASYYPDANIRKLYLKDMGVEFQENSFVNMGFLKIPNIRSEQKVIIGKNVSIAPNVVCICEANANNGKEINQYAYVTEKATCRGNIYIGDDAWIGANVTILPGITIGKCAIVGAGSVVTKDIDAYGVYAGVPARKIRDVRKWSEDENE